MLLDEPSKGAPLTLNSLGLQIRSAEAAGRPLTVRSDPKKESIELGPLPTRCEEVRIVYEGKASPDGLTGFYRSHQGERGSILTTHLAPAAARRVLPCVDEPKAKAVFELEVTTDADVEVIFNTDPVEVRPHGTRRSWKFLPTPKMATYLFYLGIGKFDTLEGKEGEVRVSVKCPPGMKGSSTWALENGIKSVGAFAEYYGIPYVLPKLDLVSVRDFAAGAMENWGAITFRESAILANEGTSTFRRQVIAEIVAHEIAHQWFGNLVTMSWWNDIWLNESFATFMSYKMVDRFYPDWEILGQFMVGQSAPAFLGDSLENTHPIDVPVTNVEEIHQIFDEISYGKGASVLRMLEAFLGEEHFRAGVGSYLKRHAYGNAEGNDLWRALEEVSGVPVRRILDPWVHRPGHPVVRVRREGEKLHLTQERFRLDGRREEGTWPVPLNCRANGKGRRELFESASGELVLPECDDLSLNAGGVGFYRVRYDLPTYQRLQRHFPSLPAPERWSILRDLFAFLLSGEVEPALYREFLDQSRHEQDWMVALEAEGQAQKLHAVLGAEGPMAESIRHFLVEQSTRLGLRKRPGEGPSNGIIRESVLHDRAYLDPEFAQSLAGRFGSWGEQDPDLREAIAVGYARTEESSAIGPLLALARSARSETELEPVLAGLVSFRDSSLVQSALEWALSGESPRGTLALFGSSAARNPGARKVVWTWFRDHLPDFERAYNGTGMLTLMVERVVPYVGLGREEEVRRFLGERRIAEAETGVRKGLELLGIYGGLLRRVG